MSAVVVVNADAGMPFERLERALAGIMVRDSERGVPPVLNSTVLDRFWYGEVRGGLDSGSISPRRVASLEKHRDKLGVLHWLDWGRYLGDTTAAMATLDRLAHRHRRASHRQHRAPVRCLLLGRAVVPIS